MFISIFKTTFKNLFRSVTFWLTLSVLIIVLVNTAMSGYHGRYMPEYDEMIWDTDSRYVLTYNVAHQWISNAATLLMRYMLPILATVTAVITLNRDYGDGFFEIEKASGMKPSQYILGRLSSLLSINYIIATIAYFLTFHLYVYTRNGIEGMAFWDYLTDTTVRLFRISFFRVLPCILFFLCFTYLLGAIFKSRIVAAIGSMGYTIAMYVLNFFIVSKDGIFLDYLCPIPSKLELYYFCYDTDNFEQFIDNMNVTLTDALICLIVLIGVSTLYGLYSYILIRKRTV